MADAARDVHRKQGNELYAAGNFQGAIAEYDMDLTQSPNVLSFSNKAQCLLNLKQYDEAEKAARSALEMDWTNWKARYRFAAAHKKAHNDPEESFWQCLIAWAVYASQTGSQTLSPDNQVRALLQESLEGFVSSVADDDWSAVARHLVSQKIECVKAGSSPSGTAQAAVLGPGQHMHSESSHCRLLIGVDQDRTTLVGEYGGPIAATEEGTTLLCNMTLLEPEKKGKPVVGCCENNVRLFLSKCHFPRCNSGVLACRGSALFARKCVVENTTAMAVEIREGASATLSQCSLRHVFQGVCAYNGARSIKIDRCDVEEPLHEGFLLSGTKKNESTRKQEAFTGQHSSITCENDLNAVLTDCAVCYSPNTPGSTLQYALSVDLGAQVRMSGCEFLNAEMGVYVKGGSAVVAMHSRFVKSSKAVCVAVNYDAEVIIVRCVFVSCREDIVEEATLHSRELAAFGWSSKPTVRSDNKSYSIERRDTPTIEHLRQQANESLHPVAERQDASEIPSHLEIAFSDIQFVKKIATGSCGPVYAGTLVTNEKVAIKELTGPEAMGTCMRECGKHMMLHHRNIVRVLGVSQDGRGHAYIITKLAPRGSLADALKSHPQRNDWATLGRWALDIAHGVQYLHTLAEPILHLDLKPQNVLLFDDDSAKLCDFGIAHIMRHTVTRQTAVQCSPHYAAPEQFDVEPISEATDVYGFGGVLFAMITKLEPWDGLSLLQIAGKLGNGAQVSLPSPLPAQCPASLAAIVQRCLQIDPAQRCPLSQVIEDLIRVRDGLATQTPSRIVTQQFARGPASPDGWLDLASPSSLLEALTLFESCPAPPGRSDITGAQPTLDAIRAEYDRVAYFIPRSKFNSDREHEDAMAVGLYTDESFVYWLVNAWANDTSAERARGLRHVGPFMRRLIEALPRCCEPYSGPAMRVLRAGEGSPQVMRDAFDDFEHQFAEGTVLHFCGFASFARGNTANNAFARGASIVLFCRAVEAFDVDPYSMVRLAGGRGEKEVLCMAPSAFRVSQPPTKTQWTVTVYTEMQLLLPFQQKVITMGRPAAVQQNVRVCELLEMLQNYGLNLRIGTKELQEERDTVLAAVRQNGHALQYASAQLKKDCRVVFAATWQNKGASCHAPDTPCVRQALWNPSDFVTELFYASGRFVEDAHKLDHNINPMRPLSGFTLERVEILDEEDLHDLTALYQEMHPRSRSAQKAEAACTNDEQKAVLGMLHQLIAHQDAPTRNLLFVYHGCSVEAAMKICKKGFDCGPLRRDEGYFGWGSYTTPNAEYACRYATNEGIFPIIMINAVVDLVYPVTRSVDYLPSSDERGSFSTQHSLLFGKPLKANIHFAVVSSKCQFEACDPCDAEYAELCSSQQASLCPFAVLWVRKCGSPSVVTQEHNDTHSSENAEVQSPPVHDDTRS